MKTKLFFTAILFSTLFAACSTTNEKSPVSTTDYGNSDLKEPELQKNKNEEKQPIPVGKPTPFLTDSTTLISSASVIPNPDWDSKIIKTASMKLEIKDFKKYNDYVHNSVKQHGAYVASEEQVLSDEKTETVITIKVPVSQFENMMNTLPGNDGKVMEKRINTDDVTGEVFDTKSRLEAKKQLRTKYLEFLKQSKNMEEVVQVQNEINGIQEQIESAANRVTFLSHQASYSTVNLTFYQPLNGYQPADKYPSFLTKSGAAFKNGMAWVSNLLVGLISIWPLLLIVFAVYFGWKKLRPAKVFAQKS